MSCIDTIAPKPAGSFDILPPAVSARLIEYCKATGEEPEDVLSDAVATFLDERENDIERDILAVQHGEASFDLDIRS